MSSALRIAAVVGYLVAAFAPLLISVLPPCPKGRGFVFELCAALGLVALGQVATQFSLIARVARVSRPFGIDLVMQYHRQMGTLALVVAALHGIAAVAVRPGVFRDLWAEASGPGLFLGVAAALALAALLCLSVWRLRIHLRYETWRVAHLVLSIGALWGAFAHALLAGTYSGASWKPAALAAYCAASTLPVVYLRGILPMRLRRRPYRVSAVRPEGGSTWSVALSPDGHAGLRFAPGQFAWLRIGVSPWSVEEHPFSFSSSAARPGAVEFAIKELGDFTRSIGATAPGTVAFVDGPHGSFSPDFVGDAGALLLVAGGIGIAPMMSIVRTLADRRDERPITLIHAASSLERLAFRGELHSIGSRGNLRLIHVLSDPPPGWGGATGAVDAALLRDVVTGGGGALHAFVCGPDGMMSAVESALLELGMPHARIHMERFHLV